MFDLSLTGNMQPLTERVGGAVGCPKLRLCPPQKMMTPHAQPVEWI